MIRAAAVACVLLAATLAACADGDSEGERIVEAALLRASDLPGDGWQESTSGATIFELTDFLGLTPAALRSFPACAPYRERIVDRLIDFAHIPTRGAAATAWRSGSLPLTQVFVGHAVAVYESPARAGAAAEELRAIFDDSAAAPCLNDLAAEIGEGLAAAEARAVLPRLRVPDSRAYAFAIEAVVVFVAVGAEIEAHVAVDGEALALYLLVDFNTRFLERDGQPLLDALQARLNEAVGS